MELLLVSVRLWRPWRRMKGVDEDEGVAGLAMAMAHMGWMNVEGFEVRPGIEIFLYYCHTMRGRG